MIKKISCLFMISLLSLTMACKKDAATLVDDNSESIPPASPEAVIAPEANIAAPPTPEVAAPKPVDGKYPVMAFTKKEHDFGVINTGENVTYSFSFKNEGEGDLLITNAKGSCGCTVPEYPKEPIAPGKSGKIKVSFNSAGKHGQQHKTVTLTTNTAAGKETLDIKASIQDKAK